MTVSSLQWASFDPPMVSVALAKDSAKGAAILESETFRARLLRGGEERLARGEGCTLDPGMLEIDCAVTVIYPAGDHHLVLARVREASTSPGCPVVYWRRGLNAFQPHYSFLGSREAFREFVTRWEAGRLPKSEWSHAAHVAIGAAYAVEFRGRAFERMREGIIRHNKAVGTVNSDRSGYHETLTRFWSTVLAKVAQEFSDPWPAACEAVEQLGEERDLHCLYYSFDVVLNAEARRKWIAADVEGPF